MSMNGSGARSGGEGLWMTTCNRMPFLWRLAITNKSIRNPIGNGTDRQRPSTEMSFGICMHNNSDLYRTKRAKELER